MSLYATKCATFSRESEDGKPLDRALAYAAKNGGLPVFAHEQSRGRYFIVTGYNSFFVQYMRKKCVSERTYHEYIHGVCNLYVDIDAERFGNPQLYEDNYACELINNEILAAFYRLYGISKEYVEIIELDSSTNVKLSRHYIYNIKDENGSYTVGWESNKECGLFMRYIQSRISPRTHPGLFVIGGTKHKTRKFIVDLQPYGNDKKCMRTYMSCKPGDSRKLLRTHKEKVENITEPNWLLYLKSLACFFVGNEEKKLTRVLRVTNINNKESNINIDALIPFMKMKRSYHCSYSNNNNNDASCTNMPDEYLELVKSTLQYKMYSIKYSEEHETARIWVYNKYCAVKGDFHEQNHVYYIFNFRSGVYYQSCLVEACGGRHSEPLPIPDYTPKCKQRLSTVSLSLIFPLKTIKCL